MSAFSVVTTLTDAQKVELHTALCDAIADGLTIREALRTITNPLTGQPLAWSSVQRWHQASAEMAAQFARARENSGHMWASRAVDEAFSPDASENPQAGKLRFDAAKWKASVSAPRAYGTKLDLTSDGEKLAPGVVVLPMVAVPLPAAQMADAEVMPRGAPESPKAALAQLKATLPTHDPLTGDRWAAG